MKSLKPVIVFMLLCLVGTSSAWADHRHHHGPRVQFGVVIGPSWGPWYPYPRYYRPPYYYQPMVIERAPPPVYIEQPPVSTPPVQAAYWYFCPGANGYYPYVQQCPGGWQTVSPRPPG